LYNLADPNAVTYRRITYTADNMPARIVQPNAKCPEAPAGAACPEQVEFVYDGGNERGRKASTAGSTYYIGKHFEVVNGLPTRYIFAGDLRLSKVTSSGVLHLHKDHLTSTAAVSNAAGEKIDSADFIPFGQERNHSGQRVTHYKYTDQELDSETGLYNYKARLYDPHTGSFVTPDPYFSPNLDLHLNYSKLLSKNPNLRRAGEDYKPGEYARYFGDSQKLNRYAYVQNNPVNRVDPLGLEVLNPNNYPIQPHVWHALEYFNNYIGCDKDIIILGGDRARTSELGAKEKSQHVEKNAADIRVPDQTHLETANQALKSGIFTGIGWYQEGWEGRRRGEGPHTHVDLRPRERSSQPAQWGFDAKGNEPARIPKYDMNSALEH
jgi:RHS repeat-associated protein